MQDVRDNTGSFRAEHICIYTWRGDTNITDTKLTLTLTLTLTVVL